MLRREIYGFAESVPVGPIVIDAGAGECQYKHLFQHCSYVSVDSFVGDEYLFRQFLCISSASLEKYEQRSRWASTPPLFSVKAIKK
jgi:hypothetical protein